MTWTYHQSTGDLFRGSKFYGTGYSGHGKTRAEGRNNPEMEGVPKKGPIPRGKWLIGKPVNGTKMGPVAIQLTPADQATALHRSGFYIHGNNKADNASEGCIILALGIRHDILASGDTNLTVVA